MKEGIHFNVISGITDVHKESQDPNSNFEKNRENEGLQLLQTKTEVKLEVEEETIEDFDADEQIGIDLITKKDF